LPEDGKRYELIDGRLLVSAAPAILHFRALSLLHRLLNEQSPRHFIVGQNAGILHRRRKDTCLIPDLIVAPMNSLKVDRPALDPADALLVVEVLSPGSRKNDNVTKRHYYGRMRIPHYWIVDPEISGLHVMTLDVNQLEEQSYRDVAIVEAGTEWHTGDPFPITLDPAEFC
jgi:Uma2 family endonuclease